MRSIELFAGIGGLAIGLERSGIHPILTVERDRKCCETIKSNAISGYKKFAEWEVSSEDTRAINFKDFEDKVDLVSGGPPCQPFSMGGKHRVSNDPRDMFPEAIRSVRQIRPKAFIFENVKGLTRNSISPYLDYLCSQLANPELELKAGELWTDHLVRLERHHTSRRASGLQYNVLSRVLNAADFGIPQKRERLFIVGFRNDLNATWNFPTQTHSNDALLWSQFISGSYWKRHSLSAKFRAIDIRNRDRSAKLRNQPKHLPWVTVREALIDLPDPTTQKTNSYSGHNFQPNARIYPGHTGSLLD